MPMHAGVPLFVLISGYFGIHFSFKGLVRLLSRLYVYAVPFSLLVAIINYSGLREIMNSFLVLGLYKFWFINTYLCLYFVAPAINEWFDKASERQRWVLMAGLAFMTFYVGDFKMSDFSLVEGKNLLNFIFLYLIGRLLHIYEAKLSKIPLWVLVGALVMLSITSVLTFIFINSVFIKMRVWALFYFYNSPMLLLECCLIFLLFGKIKIQSKPINKIATSVYAMYLLHGIYWNYITDTIKYFIDIIGNPHIVAIGSFLFVILIMTICYIIDKLMSPIWNYAIEKSWKLDKWYMGFK